MLVVQAMDSGCLAEIRDSPDFFTSHLAADTDPTTVEIRLRDLIIIERRGYSRFFELPIAVIARLSFENETNPCDTKRY